MIKQAVFNISTLIIIILSSKCNFIYKQTYEKVSEEEKTPCTNPGKVNIWETVVIQCNSVSF